MSESPAAQALPTLEEFLKKFEKIEGEEAQLQSLIDYMTAALNKPTSPYFKGFWEARKRCFPLFQAVLVGPNRAQLWNRYRELTREGRELKNMLDQETAFAVEQIDLAIGSLESDFRQQKCIQRVAFPQKLKSLEKRLPFYQERQGELNALNLFASRINSLRKELVKTEMRIRHKNRFFQRLSSLGDHIFPRRKELIKELSANFERDVADFVAAHFSERTFSEEKARRMLFFFREEIKALQATAKILTLNTHSFSATREALSGCWDRLRGMEKELKKGHAEQKAQSAQNVEEMRKKIEEFAEKAPSLSVEEGRKECEAIVHAMRERELTKSDFALLKEELQIARRPLSEREEAEQKEQEARRLALENARKEKADAFEKRVEALLERDLEEACALLEEYRKELFSLELSKRERQQCECALRTVREALGEKREAALLALPAESKAHLAQLQNLIEEKRGQRREIKEQIEEYRKALGGSALDFEQAMKFNELMDKEKERLHKCDQAIEEIEQKIEACVRA